MPPKNTTKENKKPVKLKEKQQSNLASCYYIAFWSLATLLFFPPYFRGLFFPYEQELALIFAATIFWVVWLWKWSNRDYQFLSKPMDYAMLALPVIYLASAFQAVNYGLAVNELVKTMLYFTLYWLVSRLVRNKNEISTVLHASYLSAIGVALAGLMTATGIIDINDGFLNGRIYSTFQYPNALASFLGALTFVGLYFWSRYSTDDSTGKHPAAWWDLSNLGSYLYAAGNFIIFAVFLGTKSDGGMMVFAIMLALFIVGLPKSRWPVSIHFLLFSIPAGITIWQFIPNATAGRMGQAWLWVLLGLVLTLAVQWLYNCCARKGMLSWLGANKRIVIVVALLVIITGSVVTGVYISGHSESVQALVQDRNAIERLAFFQDAMKMFNERPILGWGGGGWEEAYRAYQSYLYNSNQVHGYFFQVMVEVGALGLLIVLGIWITFLHAAHRVYYRNKGDLETRFLVWTVTIAAITIGLHSVIDFDLSLSALTLVLWTMFGITRALYGEQENTETVKKVKKYEAPRYGSFAAATILSIVIISLAGCLAAANNSYKSALANLQLQNYSKGVALLQEARSYNPLSADYHSALASISQRQGEIDEAIVQTQRAMELGQYSPA
ncbi:MAG: O-antigen ligase family protein, partial [Desulfotomaculaceae bacterium]|nr:O-antigen ligase family protein [Desulfotomaculaceae bacterium]